MEASDSFYHFDVFDSEISDPKRNTDSERGSTDLLPGCEASLKFGDLGFYNEESIDLQQYLHLGNTPPSGHGDELLKQFGAYSSSPPVTVTLKTPGLASVSSNQNTTSTLTQELAGVSLSTNSVRPRVEGSVVHAALSSNATTTQLGFQIKQEVEEHSVPEVDQPIEMPPGEDQEMTIAKGDQGNIGHVGGQPFYIIQRPTMVHSEETVTSSIPGNHSYITAVDAVQNPDMSVASDATAADMTSAPKKRQRLQVLDKESDEYKSKRKRNNVAVRKSREKSKARNKELQTKVQTLQTENEKLNKKVELLTKELTVLRSLFTTVKPSANV